MICQARCLTYLQQNLTFARASIFKEKGTEKEIMYLEYGKRVGYYINNANAEDLDKALSELM
jgi:hypothetical protein